VSPWVSVDDHLPQLYEHVVINYTGGNWHALDQEGANYAIASRCPQDKDYRGEKCPYGYEWQLDNMALEARQVDRWMPIPRMTEDGRCPPLERAR